MARSLTESQKKNLEPKALLVDSERFEFLIYAVNHKRKGMHIIYKDAEIPLAADDIELFIQEIREVWNHMEVKG